MKIERNSSYEGYELEEKRLNIPFTIKLNCNGCKKELSKDLSRFSYLSYPKLGETINYIVYCNECDTENEVKIILELELKIID